ncbi:C-glycoside deglycosidase beta subunit domain-containing protein [Lachnoclostridium sp. Marseille-P6806]|uniref:C-glycoside deglycosidase beta subunit domain-containing protein n=1 Tax=Lachnoclostridium sp. Marseille-P6806 TaxID=2364793 RepID=UPI001031E68A|nr:DUF6379 domain-containing protein [Lachnoclostridium sp. Marseille-P6806]
MFDSYLIRKDSLENVYEDGKAVGFKFAVRIADYRGCYLSLHNGYYISVDGAEYPRELQSFEINGKAPRSFEEIKKCVWEHWDYDDEGYVYVKKDGGLEPGKHRIGLQQSVLAQYGYFPFHDEEWVKNPPVPGKGAGAGKTAFICYYELELSEGGNK